MHHTILWSIAILSSCLHAYSLIFAAIHIDKRIVINTIYMESITSAAHTCLCMNVIIRLYNASLIT